MSIDEIIEKALPRIKDWNYVGEYNTDFTHNDLRAVAEEAQEALIQELREFREKAYEEEEDMPQQADLANEALADEIKIRWLNQQQNPD